MTTLNFDYFYRQLEAGLNINETCLYFDNDPNEEEHYLGYNEGSAAPYWVGNCDVENGIEFKTAEELVNAPVFEGKSLKERWKNTRICSIESFPVEDWIKCMEHVGERY